MKVYEDEEIPPSGHGPSSRLTRRRALRRKRSVAFARVRSGSAGALPPSHSAPPRGYFKDRKWSAFIFCLQISPRGAQRPRRRARRDATRQGGVRRKRPLPLLCRGVMHWRDHDVDLECSLFCSWSTDSHAPMPSCVPSATHHLPHRTIASEEMMAAAAAAGVPALALTDVNSVPRGARPSEGARHPSRGGRLRPAHSGARIVLRCGFCRDASAARSGGMGEALPVADPGAQAGAERGM